MRERAGFASNPTRFFELKKGFSMKKYLMLILQFMLISQSALAIAPAHHRDLSQSEIVHCDGTALTALKVKPDYESKLMDLIKPLSLVRPIMALVEFGKLYNSLGLLGQKALKELVESG